MGAMDNPGIALPALPGYANEFTRSKETILGEKIRLEIECGPREMFVHVGPVPEPARSIFDPVRSVVTLSFDGGQNFTEAWMRDDASGWWLSPWPFAALLRQMAYSRTLSVSFKTADGQIPYTVHFDVRGLKGALQTLGNTCPKEEISKIGLSK